MVRAAASTTTNVRTADQFMTELTAIPYSPQQATAKGMLAPLIRSMGHVLYLIGAISEERHVLTPEEAARELLHASEHLDPTALTNVPTISVTAKTQITAYCNAVQIARDSFSSWPEDRRIGCLRDLAHRAAAIASYLDRELVGLASTATDPGTSL